METYVDVRQSLFMTLFKRFSPLPWLISALLGPLAPGCDIEAEAQIAGESAGRGPLGKADRDEGSCVTDEVDYCGGPSDGACHCDEDCSMYGDCCHDASQACFGPMAPRVLMDEGLHAPESVVFDEDTQTYFVSNLAHNILETDPLHPPEGNVGFISRHAADGSLLDAAWASGFASPKGLTISNGVLYVADPKAVVGIDIDTATQVARYTIEDVGLFNDVTAASDGILYATDTANPSVYRIDPYAKAGAAVQVLVRDPSFEFLNGIVLVDSTLYAASTGIFPSENDPGTLGRLYAVEVGSGDVREIEGVRGRWDGIAVVDAGHLAVNDFMSGDLHLVSLTTGESTKLLASPVAPSPETGFLSGLADMGSAGSTLLIPSMFTNEVFAHTPAIGN